MPYVYIYISVIPYFGDIHANLLAIFMVSRVAIYHHILYLCLDGARKLLRPGYTIVWLATYDPWDDPPSRESPPESDIYIYVFIYIYYIKYYIIYNKIYIYICIYIYVYVYIYIAVKNDWSPPNQPGFK